MVFKQNHSEESKKKISEGLKIAYKNGKKIPIRMFGKDNPFYKGKHTIENIEIIKKANIGKKLSKERLEKMRLAQLGENGSNWKGGITPLNKILRQNSKWGIWRELVFLRDNFTCQNPNCSFCNNKLGINLHPHHIKPLSIFPELVFDVNNGITYCSEFHLKSGLHKELNLIKENENVARCT